MRARIVNAFLFFAVLLFVLLAADIGLRLFGWKWLYPRPHALLYHREWPILPSVPRYEPNRVYENGSIGDLASLMPGPRRKRPMRFVTDELGFRNEPGARHRENDLVLLGDSFAAGDGTTQSETWAARLEQSGLRVYNLGISGSPWQEAVNLRVNAGQIRTKPGAVLVWQLFPANDFDEKYMDTTDPSRLMWSAPPNIWRLKIQRWIQLSPWRQMILRLTSGRQHNAALIEKNLAGGTPVYFYSDYLRTLKKSKEEILSMWSYPHLKNVMRDVKDEARKRGWKLVLVIVPSKEELYLSPQASPTPATAAILDICAEEGLDCEDWKDEFLAASRESEEPLYWPDDTHWNARGHALAAKLTQKILSN